MNRIEFKKLCDQKYPYPQNTSGAWDARENFYNVAIYVGLGEVAKIELEGNEQDPEVRLRLMEALGKVVTAAFCGASVDEIEDMTEFDGFEPKEWPLEPLGWGERIDQWQSSYMYSNVKSADLLCRGYEVHPHEVLVWVAQKMTADD